MKNGEWLGLTLTREVKTVNKTKIVDVTDEYAIAYAAKKFGVNPEDIELDRDATLIKVRPYQDDEVEFMSFDQFIYEVYGIPDTTDEHYNTFEQFGYGVWLSRKYPDEWGTGERDKFLALLREDYHWYRLEEYLECELDEESVFSILNDFLASNSIYIPKPGSNCKDSINFPEFTCGILVWSEDPGELFILFIDGEGALHPVVVKDDCVEDTGEIFEGFE